MKLPDDKKERTQILVLIGMGVALVGVGLYFGIGYVRDRKKAMATESTELTENIRKANLEIDKMSKDRKDNAEVLFRVKDLSDKYLLKPRIGNNYYLSAAEIVEVWAQKAKLTPRVVEAGIVGIPMGGSAVSPIRGYTVRLSLSCDYNELVRFIRIIQDDNPLVAVMNIMITGQKPPAVASHSVSFDVQWPIWGDGTVQANVEARVAALRAEQEKR